MTLPTDGPSLTNYHPDFSQIPTPTDITISSWLFFKLLDKFEQLTELQEKIESRRDNFTQI